MIRPHSEKHTTCVKSRVRELCKLAANHTARTYQAYANLIKMVIFLTATITNVDEVYGYQIIDLMNTWQFRSNGYKSESHKNSCKFYFIGAKTTFHEIKTTKASKVH